MTDHAHTFPKPVAVENDYTTWATDSGFVMIPVEIAEQRRAEQRRQLGITSLADEHDVLAERVVVLEVDVERLTTAVERLEAAVRRLERQ